MSFTPPSKSEFTRKDFLVISKLLHEHTGIHMLEEKSTLIHSRLRKRIRRLGLESFRDYCALVSSPGNDELKHMCDALTTNVTSFFRENHHFEHLRTFVLPDLLAAARIGKKIRIWSAGCSSGEEPYSIALTILSLMPEAFSLDIKVLATDINQEVIHAGVAGIYRAEDIANVDRALCSKWMRPVNKRGVQHYQLDEVVRGLVTFRLLNLAGNWPMRGSFQVIFCRNVVIYFDSQTQIEIWNRMMPLLDLNGTIYAGHSERLIDKVALLTKCVAATTYRKTLSVAA